MKRNGDRQMKEMSGMSWVLCLSVMLHLSPVLCRAQVKLILETDMESDVDDAATLALLHALADNGECELLAVMPTWKSGPT